VKIDVGITSVLRRYLVGALLVGGLVACAPVPTVPPAPSDITFRNPSANIGATARFDPMRFAGDWHVVARFVETGESAAHDVIAVTYHQGKDRIVVVASEGAQTYAYDGTAVLRPKQGEPLIIMWVDESFRTAVLGTTSGQDGYILDRKPNPRKDRLKAATEILKFYGWDTRRLKRTKR
jgi:apolipoprotein D and lipocalin family protein